MNKFTLKEIENYWLNSSDDSLDTAKKLIRNKKYVHAMFFLHLTIEKMLKCLYVNRENAEAPIGHNLLNLASKIKGIDFNKSQLEELAQITTFNIAARYDDYKNNFYKICDEKFAKNYIKICKELII